MRKKGFAAAGLFVLLVLAVYFFFTDDWLERRLEKIGSAIVGARVEIDDLDLNLLTLRGGWKRLQIADPNNPWKNLLETGRARFDLAAEPLFFGRWIIEELRLENVRSGTPRDSDGSLPEKKKSAGPDYFGELVKQIRANMERASPLTPDLLSGRVNVDAILKGLDLRTPHRADSLRKAVQAYRAKWQGTIDRLPRYSEELKKLERVLRDIDVSKIKGMDDLLQALEKIESVRNKLDSLKRSFEEQKQALLSEAESLRKGAMEVNDWIRNDVEQAFALAQLPDLRPQSIAKMVFGPGLVEKAEKAARYFAIAKGYADQMAPAAREQKPERLKGINVRFPDRRNWPSFWIKKVVFSAATAETDTGKQLYFAGTGEHFTTEPRKVGQPTRLTLKGGRKEGRYYELFALWNYMGPVPLEQYNIMAQGISLNRLRLFRQAYLPAEVRKGEMEMALSIILRGKHVTGVLSLSAMDLEFAYPESRPPDQLTQIFRDVFSGVRQLNVQLRLLGRPERLQIALKSNLDQVFARRLQQEISGRVEKARRELESRILHQLEPHRKEIQQMIVRHIEPLMEQIHTTETMYRNVELVAEKKKEELKKRVEQEKEKGLEQLKKKAKDRLKKIIK